MTTGAPATAVPLVSVADMKIDQGPSCIDRYDRQRQATVAADLVGTAALGEALARRSRAAGDEEPAEGREASRVRATPRS